MRLYRPLSRILVVWFEKAKRLMSTKAEKLMGMYKGGEVDRWEVYNIIGTSTHLLLNTTHSDVIAPSILLLFFNPRTQHNILDAETEMFGPP